MRCEERERGGDNLRGGGKGTRGRKNRKEKRKRRRGKNVEQGEISSVETMCTRYVKGKGKGREEWERIWAVAAYASTWLTWSALCTRKCNATCYSMHIRVIPVALARSLGRLCARVGASGLLCAWHGEYVSRGERSTAQRTPLKAAAAATHTGKIARARARARRNTRGGGFLLVPRFFFYFCSYFSWDFSKTTRQGMMKEHCAVVTIDCYKFNPISLKCELIFTRIWKLGFPS